VPRAVRPVAAEAGFVGALREQLRPGLEAMRRGVAGVPALVLRARRGEVGAAGAIRGVVTAAYVAALGAFSEAGVRAIALRYGLRAVDHNARELARQLHAALGAAIHVPTTGTEAAMHGYLEHVQALAADVLLQAKQRIESDALRLATGGRLDQLEHVDELRLDAEAPIEHATGNVQLIKSIATSTREKLAAGLTAAHAAGDLTPDQVQELLMRRLRFGESRAELIAVDQVGKLFGQVNRDRQMALGIEKFRWMTKRDPKVRKLHRPRHRIVFRWDSPPSDGIPGFPIRCRCHGDPVVDDLRALVNAPDELAAMRGEVARARRIGAVTFGER